MNTVKRFLANPITWSFIIFFVLLIIVQMTGAKVATIPGTNGATQFGNFGTTTTPASQTEEPEVVYFGESFAQSAKFFSVQPTALVWIRDPYTQRAFLGRLREELSVIQQEASQHGWELTYKLSSS